MSSAGGSGREIWKLTRTAAPVAEATGKRDASGNPEVRQFLLEVWPSGDGTSLRLLA